MEMVPVVGRVLFAAYFMAIGMVYLARRAETVAGMRRDGWPAPELIAPLAGGMLLAGGLSVLLGWYAWISAWPLAAALLVSAFARHRFWGRGDRGYDSRELSQFFQHVALAGAALLITYFGTGPASMTP